MGGGLSNTNGGTHSQLKVHKTSGKANHAKTQFETKVNITHGKKCIQARIRRHDKQDLIP